MNTTRPDAVNSSPPPLRVLILEDNPRDAKLIARVLEDGGGTAQFEITGSRELFLERLERAEYDVILADFNLRNWNAFDALDILKRSGKDIPFIVVTGSLGDEAAVECIKQGAADFILKDRPARLPAAVQQALEEKRLRAERKRAERELLASEARYRDLVEMSPEALFVNRNNRIVYVNPSALKLFGATNPEQVLGKSPFDVFHPDDHLGIRQRIELLQKGQVVPLIEERVLRLDGSVRYAEVAAAPFTDQEGLAIQVVLRDITERQRAEETAERLTHQVRSILEAAGEGIYGVDAEDLLTFVNPSAARILGYEAEELIGRKSHALWHHTRPDGTAFPFEDCMAHSTLCTGIATQGEDWFWRRDGSGFPVQLAGAPIKESGKVVGAVITFNDISERRQAEEALAKRSEELERSNKELQQFAYVASHDLQEPLRTVASFAQLLQRRYQGKLDANADDFIHFIVEGATRMQGLIHDLLAYSRVGSHGKDFVPTDCTTVFDQAVANLQMAVTESGAVVTHDSLPTVPCDGAQLIQVFQNLVGNSIKFRDSQTPRVHVAAEQRPSGWVFSVKDNGIGIDLQYADRIFEVFQRLHNRTEYPGSGIGLAITKKIVERHGGRIWVKSQPHEGATFFFTLPA